MKLRTDIGDLETSTLLTVVHEDKTLQPTVKSSIAGMLVCIKHASACWCGHIEDAIEGSHDSRSIFEDYHRSDVVDLWVPIFPDGHLIYAQVYLTLAGDTAFRAFLWNPQSVKHKKGEPKIYLGLISEGDGRFQLRQMILGWMHTWIPQEPPGNKVCKSMRHTYGRQEDLVRGFKSDTRRMFVESWSIYWYNKCHLCLLDEGILNRFDRDLIPL